MVPASYTAYEFFDVSFSLVKDFMKLTVILIKVALFHLGSTMKVGSRKMLADGSNFISKMYSFGGSYSRYWNKHKWKLKDALIKQKCMMVINL